MNESEPIRINRSLDLFKLISNPNRSDFGLKIWYGFITIHLCLSLRFNWDDSDWFLIDLHRSRSKTFCGFQNWYGFITIHLCLSLRFNWDDSDWFFIDFYRSRSKTFFGLVRNNTERDSVAALRAQFCVLRGHSSLMFIIFYYSIFFSYLA